MTIEFKPAKRDNAPLLIGLAGGTGSGKTFSALRLARGLAGGQPFAMIDTENGRANHYADYFPEMMHGDLRAPFTPAAYAQAVKAAAEAGYGVIVVDSASHEYEGVGGVLDMQEEELVRLMRGDESRRESVRASSWIVPKRVHKKEFVHPLLQVGAHVILCLRAEDKIEFVKENGRTVVRPRQTLKGAGLDGWVPICEKRLPFELTLSFLLTSENPGVPKFIKIEEHHRPFFPDGQQVGESTGKSLAAWAAGGKAAPSPLPEPEGAALASQQDRRRIFAQAKNLGVDEVTLREIVLAATTQESTAAIPASKVDEILEAITAAAQELPV